MKNQLLAIILFISAFYFFSGCQNYDEILLNEDGPKENVFVKDNILHFKDYKVFKVFLDSLNLMTASEFNQWEKNIGFISIRTEFSRAMTELDNCITDSEQNTVLEKYKHILQVNDNTVKPILEERIYASIVGHDMIYCVGNDYFKIKDGYIYKAQSLENILDETSFNLDKFQYIMKDFKSACGTNTKFSKVYIDDDRRCDVAITLVRVYFNYGYPMEGFHNYIYYSAVAYKYYLGKWRRYKTTISARWGEYEVSVPNYNESTQTWNWFHLSGGSQNILNETYGDELISKITLDSWTNLEGPGDLASAKYFKALYLNSNVTTTGIGAYWVNVGCSE